MKNNLEKTKIIIGRGALNWNRMERVSDRYGTVKLFLEPHSDTEIQLPVLPLGKKGKLIATVLETRTSGHIGDLFRGIFPVTPKVGEKIVLGNGTLFMEQNSVGLYPSNKKKKHDWLDPKKLYQAHDQTVELSFEET